MPLYTSPEQLMRERSELARKGIARGRSVVALKYADGILFVAENPSSTLRKMSEIYDRIGFAAAGRYSEYENLRRAGIKHVDLWGYSYDPRDVSARQLANALAQTLGSIFTEQLKPFEVELCVAEVGTSAEKDQLYRLTYDGSIVDEPQYVVMGGQTDSVVSVLKDNYAEGLPLTDAVSLAVQALSAPATGSGTAGASGNNGGNGGPRELGKLEVAVLDRGRPRRAFRRISGAALDALLPKPQAGDGTADSEDTSDSGNEAGD